MMMALVDSFCLNCGRDGGGGEGGGGEGSGGDGGGGLGGGGEGGGGEGGGGERVGVRLAARQQGRLGVRLVRRAAGAGRRRRLDQGRGTSSAAYLRTAVNGAASGTFIL